MLNLWFALFTALWSVALEKLCLCTLKGQARKAEPDLASWKRADLQPREPIMNKMQQQEWRSATKHREKGLFFFFLLRRKNCAISAGKRAAQLVGWFGAFASKHKTKLLLIDVVKEKLCCLMPLALCKNVSVAAFCTGNWTQEKQHSPLDAPRFFLLLLKADSRLCQTMSEPKSCPEFSIRKDGLCFQLFWKRQAAAHRSVVTSSELAQWHRQRGFWR